MSQTPKHVGSALKRLTENMAAETVGYEFCGLCEGRGATAWSEKPRDAHHVAFQAVIGQIRPVLLGAAPWPLFFKGPAGCGKTCAALLLLDWAGGLLFTVADWCEQIIDAMNCRLGEHGFRIYPREVREKMQKTNLFVLDEVGFNPTPTPFEVSEVHRILLRRENRPLIVISNYGLTELGKAIRYGDTLSSRLSGGTMVEFPNVDYRAKR